MKIVNIEQLQPSQVAEIVKLDRICLGGLWTEEGYLREINSPNSILIVLLFQESDNSPNKIVGLGCLWAIVDEAHITLLGVDPNYRRQGLGQLLLLNLLEQAISLKLKRATLEVNVNNANAINLYQKYGFQVLGKRKGYYQSTGEDALILWRKELQTQGFQLNLSQWQQNVRERLQQNKFQLNYLKNC